MVLLVIVDAGDGGDGVSGDAGDGVAGGDGDVDDVMLVVIVDFSGAVNGVVGDC